MVVVVPAAPLPPVPPPLLPPPPEQAPSPDWQSTRLGPTKLSIGHAEPNPEGTTIWVHVRSCADSHADVQLDQYPAQSMEAGSVASATQVAGELAVVAPEYPTLQIHV